MVTIHVTPKPVNVFIPAYALGAGVDGAEAGTAARTFRPDVLAAMRSMRLRPLTYRLRTELGIEAWHWNGRGRWSDPRGGRGYWTSSADPHTGPISVGWGYRLPRRGSTVDQANDDGYSRIDDGDRHTFWKSNPYLDRRFTGEPNRTHPQWVVVDFGQPQPIGAIRLAWGAPYAVRYRVEYGAGPEDRSSDDLSATVDPDFRWVPFPHGTVTTGRGGDGLLRLAATPIRTRFVRIWMTESSSESTKAPAGGGDPRDRAGYALREIYVGRIAADGRFHDAVRHGRRNGAQTPVVASSCDPWHTAHDRDTRTEQPGFDRVWSSGLTGGEPVMVPVGVLYDTPENAVAELQYLKARGLTFDRVELGEEPDGQYVMPEDYGALYCRFARAIRSAFPQVSLGGPSLQTDVYGWHWWPDAHGDALWMRRFLSYLKAHGAANTFQFFSFEWYPIDDLRASAAHDLAEHAALLDGVRKDLLEAGVPPQIPWIISEYGWSSFAAEEEDDLPGALMNAEIPARFLQQGGSVAYLYGYAPNTPIREQASKGATWGDLMPFLADDDGNIRARLPMYWSARLLTTAWAADGADADRSHRVYRATLSVDDPLLTAYPILRPDGSWAVLLLNKDPRRARVVRLQLERGGADVTPMTGPLDVWRYSSVQYAWKSAGENGHPLRSLPPEHLVLPASAAGAPPTVTLPPFSLCVVRTRPGGVP